MAAEAMVFVENHPQTLVFGAGEKENGKFDPLRATLCVDGCLSMIADAEGKSISGNCLFHSSTIGWLRLKVDSKNVFNLSGCCCWFLFVDR